MGMEKACVMDILYGWMAGGACYRSELSSNSKPSASRSSGGMSPRWRSCSGRKFRLPGEPVMIENVAVVGEMFPDETDLFAR